MQDCLTEDVVVTGPDFKTLARGKQACLTSYQEFVRTAKVTDYRLSEPKIEILGSSAVATYSWEIAYKMQEQEQHDLGRDLFIFIRQRGKWLAAWRAVLMAGRP